jgi:predicted ATPase
VLTVLAVSNYRSLRNLVVPLRGLNVVTGANGSGKSSLYRALHLLADTAQGRVVPSLAREGGLQSTLWAGPETVSRSIKRGDFPVQGTLCDQRTNLCLGFASDGFGYLIDLGVPAAGTAALELDPVVKQECIWHGPLPRPSTILVERRGPVVRIRNKANDWNIVTQDLSPFDTMMMQAADPQDAPEMLTLRESIRAWRFYDHFRTDAGAPARSPQVGTYTPVLCDDGADVAAALETIRKFGDRGALDATVADAFPASQLEISVNSGRYSLQMKQHGLLRALDGAELSDGTLRYILWIAALLTTRPPALMVLNEPETSLHPSLLAPLARLIARAATKSQVIVVTHAPPLIGALNEQPECHSIQLEKTFGETNIVGAKRMSLPPWQWPSR